eukprot:jgi/Ulvmu1/7395/UM036_0055.1
MRFLAQLVYEGSTPAAASYSSSVTIAPRALQKVWDAARRGDASARDGKLRDVLRVLAGAGWQMDVRDEKSGENAAHLLAGQIGGAVEERLKFLVHTVKQTPLQHMNLLTVTDAICATSNGGPVAVVAAGGSASGTTAAGGSASVVMNGGALVNDPGPVPAGTVVSPGRRAGSSEAAQVIHPEIGCVVA